MRSSESSRWPDLLGSYNETSANGLHGFAQWLAGEEVVAEINGLERSIIRSVGGQPPFRRPVLAILFVSAVLRHNELGFEGNDLVVSRRDHCRRQHGVEILGFPILALPRRAVLAVKFVRAKVFSSIKGNQYMTAKAVKRLKEAGVLLQTTANGAEYWEKLRRRCRIQRLPDLIVLGDLVHTEKALAVRTSVSLLKPPLMGEKRRALHEKRRERRHAEIRHPVLSVRSRAVIRERAHALPQCIEQGLDRLHPRSESDSSPEVERPAAP